MANLEFSSFHLKIFLNFNSLKREDPDVIITDIRPVPSSASEPGPVMLFPHLLLDPVLLSDDGLIMREAVHTWKTRALLALPESSSHNNSTTELSRT